MRRADVRVVLLSSLFTLAGISPNATEVPEARAEAPTLASRRAPHEMATARVRTFDTVRASYPNAAGEGDLGPEAVTVLIDTPR